MKKVILTLCILSGSIAWTMAEDPVMDVKQSIVHAIMGGVIKKVSWADPVKGTKSEIMVIDSAKKSTNIYVTSTTTLWDADEKAIMQDKITPRSHVNIIYLTTPEGINIGKSIKILK